KLETAKVAAGIKPGSAITKGTRLPVSSSRTKAAAVLASLHYRIANVRSDFTHKTTNRLCRENQAAVIEDLNVAGMLRNENLARAISDVGFGKFRRQMRYKSIPYGTRLVIADRWYPSSKTCSECGFVFDGLTLKDGEWTCPHCGAHHERDVNAAKNLKRLATATALPVASSAAMPSTDVVHAVSGGKVTPVRYDFRPQEGSGQEDGCAHFCAQLE
ncbi:MAG TPA: transposase, partial [Thermodesulfovibrionales bacterium]|nr:transposase [Thermodesulfovibrionales bacterium]